MEERKLKAKAYVIGSKTLKELKEPTENSMDSYALQTIYEINIDRDGMSEKQKEFQLKNDWYREHRQEFRVRDKQIYNLVKKLTIKRILDGDKKDIKKLIYDDVYNTEIKIIATINKNSGYSTLNTYTEFGEEDEWGNKMSNTYDYSYDMDEFKRKAQDFKYKNSFSMGDGEYVLLEKIKLEARPYKFNEIKDIIKRQINKFVKEELTYCLKNDEVIIPEEYINKGEEGIKEWRDIKSSKNKNNSIEKKILREAVNEKKRYAFRSMCRVMDAIESSTPISWSMPFISIDGRYNKQRTSKLVNKLIDNKSPQYYIDTTEEELMNKFKEYWKNILTKAIDNVDKLTVMEEEKK